MKQLRVKRDGKQISLVGVSVTEIHFLDNTCCYRANLADDGQLYLYFKDPKQRSLEHFMRMK